MCRTAAVTRMQQPPSSSFSSPKRQTKRSRDNGDGARPPKRVTFSSQNHVLGRAQDYDRASFEEPTPQRDSMATRQQNTPGVWPQITTPHAHEVSATEGGHANFCGMWRRSHGFNWSALLELTGVPKDAVPEQVTLV